MRKSMSILALLIAGCTSQPQQSDDPDGKMKKEVSRRVDSICSLPKEEQQAAIEKLKAETGLVLFCGSDE